MSEKQYEIILLILLSTFRIVLKVNRVKNVDEIYNALTKEIKEIENR